MAVKTRFAPSPTGYLHIGGVRTALFSWLYARHYGGQFVLRIEDTDRERSTQEAVDIILDGMRWLGLDCDEGPYYQTARMDRYREVADRMLAEGTAYHCWCSREELDRMRADQVARGENPHYDGRCREGRAPRPGVSPVVRFRSARQGITVVEDLIRGRVEFSNAEIDDLVIVRSDGSPTFHFCVVVDDGDMGITHVIRGDDHLNNTPKHIQMMEALGIPLPAFAHLPMILGSDGSKLSKRHGAVNVLEYREQGYLSAAVLNYLVRLGWSHGDQEVFTLDEMIRLFDLDHVNASAARFDPEKLGWLNQQHLRAADPAQLAPGLRLELERAGIDWRSGPPAEDVVLAFRERATSLREMADNAWYLYREIGERDPAVTRRHLTPAVVLPLHRLFDALSRATAWDRATIHAAMTEVAAQCGIGFGKLGQPVRVAVTGGTVSPPIDVTLELLGRERSLARLKAVVTSIEAAS